MNGCKRFPPLCAGRSFCQKRRSPTICPWHISSAASPTTSRTAHSPQRGNRRASTRWRTCWQANSSLANAAPLADVRVAWPHRRRTGHHDGRPRRAAMGHLRTISPAFPRAVHRWVLAMAEGMAGLDDADRAPRFVDRDGVQVLRERATTTATAISWRGR